MIKLQKPPFEQKDILDACIKNMREGTVKSNILSSAQEIIEKSTDYDQKAVKGELSKILEHDVLDNGATKSDMKFLYEKKFAEKDQGGRKYYDAIRLLSPNNRCPYCAQREVSTLDHYLPKSLYPTFSVTTYNLVPSCAECNFGKRTDSFENREREVIHPYYDDFSDAVWIKAKLIEKEPVAFEFFVECPEEWDEIKKKRAKNHFEKFYLNDLYKPYASEEYIACLNRIKRVYAKGGKELAVEVLEEDIIDKECIRLNTWQAAMYQAIIDSEWFWENYLPSIF